MQVAGAGKVQVAAIRGRWAGGQTDRQMIDRQAGGMRFKMGTLQLKK